MAEKWLDEGICKEKKIAATVGNLTEQVEGNAEKLKNSIEAILLGAGIKNVERF